MDHCKHAKKDCNILVSQPRKIAAITISQRVASERETALGGEVGFQVGLSRQSDTMSHPSKTKILYCTTGVILERLIHEKSLNRYTHIILDEVHERDVNIDFLLIVIRKMLSRDSPNTKIILMSATMDTDQFSEFFKITLPDGCFYIPPIIDLTDSPREFDIAEYYIEEFERIWLEGDIQDLINYDEPGISEGLYDYAVKILLVSLRQVLQNQKTAPAILVFLPGINEIETFRNKLLAPAVLKQLEVVGITPIVAVLHSTLSTEQQRLAFIPSNQTKIVLATNIAESGVTIPNVTHVLDFCLTKYLAVAKGAQISTLMTDWTSKNSCKQRAGRAGRVCPGAVVRMVSNKFYNETMKDYPAPEIQRIGLEAVIIKTKLLQMGTPLELLALALDPPDKSSVVDSVLYLKELGGLSRLDSDGSFDYTDGHLTFLGKVMGALPIDVRLSKLVIMGYIFGVLDDVIIIAAGLSLKSIFTQSLTHRLHDYIQKLDWANGSGSDCIAVLNAYNLWKEVQGSDFASKSLGEREWCERHNLDVKNLHEMELMIQEITKRLKNFNIESSDDSSLIWDSRDKYFMIKICIAGAFGPANFFLPVEHTQDGEREAFKAVNDMDLFRTVYFKNMDRELFGDIYEEQIRTAFERKHVVEKKDDMKVFFDYRITEKVFVSFGKDLPLVESGDKKVVGKVLPEVYKAVKMRQISGKLDLEVMSHDKTIKYALEQGLGTMKEGIFRRNEEVVKNPQYCVEPTTAVVKIHGYVTHVENCNKFFFRPIEALIAHTGIYDIRYKTIIIDMQKVIHSADRVPASAVQAELKAGDFVIVAMAKGFERGTFVASSSEKFVEVYLMDCGYTIKDADINTVTLMTDKEAEKKLFEIPPRVFQCTLTEVEPSRIQSREGKWTKKAIELFRTVVNHKATINVYSVVNDVASVTLFAKKSEEKVNWNLQLIQEGLAQECEESYLSKMNHEYRRERRNGMTETIWPEDEFDRKLDKVQANRVAEAPPSHLCEKRVKLQGPFSPLEISLTGISRFKSSGITIDQSSANSVLLNDDILNFHEKFCVAAEVTFNAKNRHITIRDTNLMPNICGLAVLLGLIFCPTAELRRDKKKTRYLSLLTGLGFDADLQQSYYGERDTMMPVDFELTVQDVESINHLRYCMSQMLATEPGNDLPSLVGFDKELTLKNIRKLILEIINKNRSPMDTADPIDAFNWNVDQNQTVHRSNPLGNLSTYSFIGVPPIHKMSRAMKNEMKQHIIELNKCSSKFLTLHRKLCRLCNFEWMTTPELKLHLLSKKHIMRCATFDEPED